MNKLKTIMETPTHKVEIAADSIINPKNFLAKISTQAFFRRLSAPERAQLRGSTNVVRDLKEDLDRGNVVELDEVTRLGLIESGLFSAERVGELMVLGEAHEGRLR